MTPVAGNNPSQPSTQSSDDPNGLYERVRLALSRAVAPIKDAAETLYERSLQKINDLSHPIHRRVREEVERIHKNSLEATGRLNTKHQADLEQMQLSELLMKTLKNCEDASQHLGITSKILVCIGKYFISDGSPHKLLSDLETCHNLFPLYKTDFFTSEAKRDATTYHSELDRLKSSIEQERFAARKKDLIKQYTLPVSPTSIKQQEVNRIILSALTNELDRDSVNSSPETNSSTRTNESSESMDSTVIAEGFATVEQMIDWPISQAYDKDVVGHAVDKTAVSLTKEELEYKELQGFIYLLGGVSLGVLLFLGTLKIPQSILMKRSN